MTRKVLSFVYSLSLEKSNLNWIYSMPLLHFLYNLCTPWEKAKEDIRHDEFIPEWWGIVFNHNGYTYEFNKCKAKAHEM